MGIRFSNLLMSSRIVATFRVAMVLILAAAIWFDPAKPLRFDSLPGVIFLAYGVWAVWLLAVALTDWWLEYRISRTALVVDIAASTFAFVLTNSSGRNLSSAFLAFFVYLLIAGTTQRGWRGAFGAGLAAVGALVFVSTAMIFAGVHLDLGRIGQRVGYMLVMTALVVWYAGSHASIVLRPFVAGRVIGLDPPLADVLRYALRNAGARRGLIAWTPANARHPTVVTHDGRPWRGDGVPDEVLPAAPGAEVEATLFNRPREVILQLCDEGRLEGYSGARAFGDAWVFDIDEGVLVPLSATTGRGTLLLGDLRLASRDVLPIGREIGREVGAALDRHAYSHLAHQDNLERVRDAIARDLHDSVAQSLAGASFRIEAARGKIREGEDPDAELLALKNALRAEQTHIRVVIDRLRSGGDLPARADLRRSLDEVLAEAGMQWQLEACLVGDPGAVFARADPLHEIRQIVREAVANAARHAGARKVEVSLEGGSGTLHMRIADDGQNAVGAPRAIRPRSICERVDALDGSITALRGRKGTTLHIDIPEARL
ncbi:sensor histidine kinase [Novosphingobium tardum]|uniref:Sensor histidine kinase n=1 Tax=Novosphingobium tardum TaxID=1538021 RepID=A0ABV8RJG9_9SPHN